ncbi:MAG: M20 family metallopeptidase [Sphaerochaetaceae bacterium]|nr:M20 family metallopeptidase [Sphaerochaetaceae bacterium]
MDKYNDQIKAIYAAVESSIEELKDIRTSLYHNPEIGGQEVKSSKLLCTSLRNHGFEVTENYYDYPTAFKAVYDTKKAGATIGIFAEYDALPEIGHGCGHNLICTMALGAAYGLKAVADQFGGRIIVYGTPGEENIQTKTVLAPKGAFKEADVAIMCHPNPVSTTSGTSRAIEALQIEFFGRTSHAGDCPEKGINALDAAVMCYTMINQQKEYIPGSNVHGYIENGGAKASIIPDYTSLKYLTRADEMKTLAKLRELLDNCAQAAAKAVGCTYRMQNFEETNAAMNTNRTMADVFDKYLILAGEKNIDKNTRHTGSTDMADVSVLMPAIHPYVGLGDETLIMHSTAVADCTITQAGDLALERGAKALACTGMEVMADPTLLTAIQSEFAAYQKENQ